MTDELLELRALAPEVAAPSESTTAAARAALVAAFAAEHDGPTHSAATSPRRLPGRWVRRPVRWTLLAASVLATVVVVGVVSTSGPGGADPAAAAALGRLAVVAAAQPPFALRAGQYLYVRSSSDYGGSYDSCQLHTPDRTEIWVSANESGLQRDTILTPSLFYSGQAGECAHALRAARSTVGTGATAFAPGCLSLGPPDLARLPTNPAALRAKLVARKIEGGPPGPVEDFIQVGDALRETDAPPALRAALYRVASTLPGVELLGHVRDRSGREGLGLAIDDPARGERDELIFDSATAALLAEQQTVLSARSGYRAPRGTVIGWAVYRSAIVDALPAGTPTHLQPACGKGGAGSARRGGPRLTIVTGAGAPTPLGGVRPAP